MGAALLCDAHRDVSSVSGAWLHFSTRSVFFLSESVQFLLSPKKNKTTNRAALTGALMVETDPGIQPHE